ncbi:MAG: nucleoside triphosphate pyrophosphohydrolase [Myxococcales bacterium]|jgi:ATP diphosphatase|nr:nucleoside triphosphate pyrophosphohydrolase [Myxococcales bacterium]
MSRAAQQLERILQIMARLRGADGCSWDKSQTPASLRPYLVEEAFEVLGELDRIADGADMARTALCEELGDLLFQIVFHAQMAEEQGAFAFADVAQAISDKIERRHPQIFGDAPPCEGEALARQWAALKAEERAAKSGGQPCSALDGVPEAAPALMRAERLTEKASRVGFDWQERAQVRAKLDEELTELDEAIASGEQEAIEAELGDVLFSVVNLSRFVAVHPEDALRGAIRRFEARFRHLECALQCQGKRPSDEDLDALEALWQEAKRALRAAGQEGGRTVASDPSS